MRRGGTFQVPFPHCFRLILVFLACLCWGMIVKTKRKIYMPFKRMSKEFHVFVVTHCFRIIKTSSFWWLVYAEEWLWWQNVDATCCRIGRDGCCPGFWLRLHQVPLSQKSPPCSWPLVCSRHRRIFHRNHHSRYYVRVSFLIQYSLYKNIACFTGQVLPPSLTQKWPKSFISRYFTCSTPTSALRYFLAWSFNENCKHLMLQTLFESTFLVLYNTIYTSIPGLLFSKEHKLFCEYPLKRFLIAKLIATISSRWSFCIYLKLTSSL